MSESSALQGSLTAQLVMAVTSGDSEVSFWTGTAKPQELHPEMAPVTPEAWLSETFALLRFSMPLRLEVQDWTGQPPEMSALLRLLHTSEAGLVHR